MNRIARAAMVLAGTFLLATSGVSPLKAQAQATTGLTAARQLALVYDAIFDARFDDVPRLLGATCGPAPREACQVLEAVALWWEIQLDPANRALDERFDARVNTAITATEAWTAREPMRAEAWFYMGGAYGARVQFRVLRGSRLAAARDGQRIKTALERAIALDPTMEDAYFGIGLYHYYAAVAPAAARVVRWLLLLPGGNRDQGLRELMRSSDRGVLVRSEADYQLHVLYLWYEKQPERGLALMEALRRRHPENPYFQQMIAEIEDQYLHDATSSLRAYQDLLTSARGGGVRLADLAEATARLGLARQLDALFETDAAIEHLRALLGRMPTKPFGAESQAHLQLGRALDRLGRRAEAISAYRAAIATAAPGDPLRTAQRGREGLNRAPGREDTEAYRLSLEGLRALERGRLDEADTLIGRSLALRPGDPLTRYRRALLLQKRNDDPGALVILDALLVSRDGIPPTIYAAACMDAARVHEAQGTVAQAAALYRTAISVFGIDRRMRIEAERALARVTTTSGTPR